MSIFRKWFCRCSGKLVELNYENVLDDEGGEPYCEICGATPSSDPRHTVSYQDLEDDED